MAEPVKTYSLKEVAAICGVHVNTARRYIRAGRLKATQLGNGKRRGRNEWRVSRDEVLRVFGV